MVQSQELQDQVNFLNDTREFFDPETASSSGLSHVPCQPVSVPSNRRMRSRDSCLQPEARDSFGISRNVFEDLPAPSEPPAVFFGCSRSHAPAPCEHVSLKTGRLADQANEFIGEEYSEFCNTHTEICKEVFNLEPSLSCRSSSAVWHGWTAEEWGLGKRMSINSLTPSTTQCGTTSDKTDVCFCSNFPTDTMLSIKDVEIVESVDDLETSQSIGGHRFPNLKMLDVKIASALKKIVTTPYFNWRSKRHKCNTDFSVEDSMRMWSTKSFEWLEHMKLFLTIRIY